MFSYESRNESEWLHDVAVNVFELVDRRKELPERDECDRSERKVTKKNLNLSTNCQR